MTKLFLPLLCLASLCLPACSARAQTSGCAAAPIVPYEQVNNGSWDQTPNVTIAAGATVHFGPQPITGGSWSWTGPQGFKSSTREVGVTPSQPGANVYVATYVDPSGCSRTATFTVTVIAPPTNGNKCAANAIVPYLQVNGGSWDMKSDAAIASGATVNIGPQPITGGFWEWTGPNGFKSTSREISVSPLSAGPNIYVAKYTDSASCVSTARFTITVAGAPVAKNTGGFHWRSSAPVIGPKPDADHDVVAVKDPSIVFANGKYHVFMTTAGKGGWGLAYTSFKDWGDAPKAPVTYLDRAPLGKRYCAAPQVFYFAPQKLWYLIFQGGDPQYSTTANIDDPLSWSVPKPFFKQGPDILKNNKGEVGWLDFWNICDDKKCYLFNTDDGGRFFRSETNIHDFPNGYGNTVLVMKADNAADMFEASMTYKILGTKKYVTMIEAMGSRGRYFRSWVSDGLESNWQPLAAENGQQFAGAETVAFSDPNWSRDVSHGELVRANNDQTPTIDPCKPLLFLYQGLGQHDDVKDYVMLPYKLGVLIGDDPNPISAMCTARSR